jgi:hypothetical protein
VDDAKPEQDGAVVLVGSVHSLSCLGKALHTAASHSTLVRTAASDPFAWPQALALAEGHGQELLADVAEQLLSSKALVPQQVNRRVLAAATWL